MFGVSEASPSLQSIDEMFAAIHRSGVLVGPNNHWVRQTQPCISDRKASERGGALVYCVKVEQCWHEGPMHGFLNGGKLVGHPRGDALDEEPLILQGSLKPSICGLRVAFCCSCQLTNASYPTLNEICDPCLLFFHCPDEPAMGAHEATKVAVA